VIEGLVMTFVDIHEQMKAQYVEEILDTVRESLLVLGEDLLVKRANKSFYRTFEVHPKETEGRRIYDLGNGQWDIPELRKLLEKIIPKDSAFEGFEVEHEFPKVGRKKMLLNARRMKRREGRPGSILLAIEDITHQ
jgi:two-component system CheB/CheR fusion protein